jgi:hypothetical protein
MNYKKPLFPVCLLTALLLAGAPARAETGIDWNWNTFTHLPREGVDQAMDTSSAYINNNGLVAINYYGNSFYGKIWDSKSDTLTHFDSDETTITGINDNGVASVQRETPAVFTADGKIIDYYYGDVDAFVWTYGINNSGIVVGARNLGSSTNTAHAVVWNEGGTSFTDLHPSADNDTVSMATAINNNGIIAGYTRYTSSSVDGDAVMWDAEGTFSLLPSVEGATSYNQLVINDAGIIAGTAYFNVNNHLLPHAVVWDTGEEIVTDLHLALGENYFSSQVLGINEAGILAGCITSTAYEQQGVLWIPGEEGYELINIHQLALAAGLLVEATGTNTGFTSITAITDINDLGQIVGLGNYRYLREEGGDSDYSFRQEGFLLSAAGLVPVPESGAWAVMAGGMMLASVVWMRRRRGGASKT